MEGIVSWCRIASNGRPGFESLSVYAGAYAAQDDLRCGLTLALNGPFISVGREASIPMLRLLFNYWPC
eukprot:5081939-Amphidinium_carterae.1